MPTKLHQVIAVEKGVKSRTHADLTRAHHDLQKPALLSGISRTYQPADEGGETFPPEATRVQLRATEVIGDVVQMLTRLFDVTATREWANTHARADLVVDGETLIEQVPVTYLLFLEKQLTDLRTFIAKLPVLDPAETWTFDPTVDAYATGQVMTTRTRKVPRNHVKAEATKEHPAQVEVYYEDVTVGHWRTVKFSGALPASQVKALRGRVERLQEAVKVAREEANALEVAEAHVGARVLDYLFGDVSAR
jgi:hypothetical protein